MSVFNNPISSEKADRLISLLDLRSDGRVLDVGCGNGEFLIRVIERYGVTGLGIDNSPEAIASARENAGGRITEPSYEFRECDARSEPLGEGAFDLSI